VDLNLSAQLGRSAASGGAHGTATWGARSPLGGCSGGLGAGGSDPELAWFLRFGLA
jgi:hypothetical protein